MDWIKIMCNILDHRKIKMIRKGPEGNTLVLLWLLMLAEAGKCNRAGYMMIADRLHYTDETLSMVLELPLPIVQLGIATFSRLEMIDQEDGVIIIKNWCRYQSEDKLIAKREQDRERKQRHRQRQKEKMLLLLPTGMSRDSHADASRDVTVENRADKNKEEITTEDVRMMLFNTVLSKITDKELAGLTERHGIERLLQAADVAAETCRREPQVIRNPGGYLHAFCCSLVVPDWYRPPDERRRYSQAAEERKLADLNERENERIRAEKEATAMEDYWASLSASEQEIFRAEAIASMPTGLRWPEVAIAAQAVSMAWEQRSQLHTNESSQSE